MKKYLNKIINFLKNVDLVTLLYVLQANIPKFLFSFNHFYLVRCIDSKTKIKVRPLNKSFNIIIKKTSKNELDQISTYLDIDLKVILLQINNDYKNTHLIGIKEEDKIIAITFFKQTNRLISPSGYSTFINKDKVQKGGNIFGTYIHPDYRLKGFLIHLYFSALKLLKQNKLNAIFGEIHFMNKPSILSHARLGFKVFKNIYYVSIFNLKFFWEGKKFFWCIPVNRQ